MSRPDHHPPQRPAGRQRHHAPPVETASLGVWVDVGTRNERAEVNGVAHLLEHMAFKGTRDAAPPATSPRRSRRSAAINAYTTREHTAYYARVLEDDVAAGARPDRPTCCSTRRSTEASSRRSAPSCCRRSGRPRTRPTTSSSTSSGRRLPRPADRPADPGARRIVAACRARRWSITWRRHYGPPAGAGRRRPVEHDRLVDLAERLFRDLPARDRAGRPSPRAMPAATASSTATISSRSISASPVEGVPYHDPDSLSPLQVLSTALGGGMSSRLFQEVRENRGLCYSVFSFASAYADTGLLGIYAGTDPEDRRADAGGGRRDRGS